MKSLECKSGPNTAASNIPSAFMKCEHVPLPPEKQIMKTKHERADSGTVLRWESGWSLSDAFHTMSNHNCATAVT